VNLKATNGWTDKSFTKLLMLLNEMLSKGNALPTRNYDAKKILCPMGMEYKRLHACPSDFIFYRKEFEDLKKSSKCGSSRYKQKEGSTLKVVWYLLVVLILKRLFAKDVKNLRCMQLREDVMDCFIIQLIQCNGKILIRSFPSSVKNVEIFDLAELPME